MKKEELDEVRTQLSLESKNGIDFTLAATIMWAAIAFVWSLDISSYNRAVLVFIAGGPMLPLAFLMSKILKTNWKVKDNPLQPLGLWFNFAQLFYFPLLVYILVKSPDDFIMGYSIITGAHFFPYAWFYKTASYAVAAGIISAGALVAHLTLAPDQYFYIGLFTSICLLVLTVTLVADLKRKKAVRIEATR